MQGPGTEAPLLCIRFIAKLGLDESVGFQMSDWNMKAMQASSSMFICWQKDAKGCKRDSKLVQRQVANNNC